jgi:hypothetical protein
MTGSRGKQSSSLLPEKLQRDYRNLDLAAVPKGPARFLSRIIFPRHNSSPKCLSEIAAARTIN